MKKPSQKQIILDYLKTIKHNAQNEEGQWVREYALRSTNTPFGWLGFQADRRCRELHQNGKIERRLNGKYAEYRYKETELPSIVVNNRPARLFELARPLF